MHKRIEMEVEGVTPLLCHNSRLANPMDPIVVEIAKLTSKRKKTLADHKAISCLEFHGGLYLNGKSEPVIPGENVEAWLVTGAKKRSLGEVFKGAVLSDGNWPIIYDGPKDPDKMWKSGKFTDVRSVVVKTSRIQRTRPIWHAWGLAFIVHYLPDLLNFDQVKEAAQTAARLGFCDGRPRFGQCLLAKCEAMD